MINRVQTNPANKKIGESFNDLIDKILLAIGIKLIETKVAPQRYAS